MVSIEKTTIKDRSGDYKYIYLGSYKKVKRGSELSKLYPSINFIVEETKTTKKYVGPVNKVNQEQIQKEIRKMKIKKPIKIEDLKDKMTDINLIATIKLVQPLREWNGQKVTSARIEDETGECNLDLWNEDAINFKEGDRIRLSSGFAKEKTFTDNGELIHTFDLTKGRYGILKKVS